MEYEQAIELIAKKIKANRYNDYMDGGSGRGNTATKEAGVLSIVFDRNHLEVEMDLENQMGDLSRAREVGRM